MEANYTTASNLTLEQIDSLFDDGAAEDEAAIRNEVADNVRKGSIGGVSLRANSYSA